MYSNSRVAEFIESSFVALRFHIKEQPATWHRFSVRWTPTILILAPDGKEQHRIEGFLPTDEFLAQLHLGLGYWEVNRKKWEAAEQQFATAANEFPESEAAPEALYWAGVSRYSASHDGGELKKLTQQFKTRYKDTSWAKRASVW